MTIITPTGIAGITSITSTGNTLQFQNPSGNAVNVSGVNVTSGTDINVSGIVTASGFVGNVTGNITGNLSGNVTGNVNATGVSTLTTLRATSVVGVNTLGVTTAYVGSINDGPISGARNRIINGDMRIDQRNNGASITVSGDPQYTLDRWYGARGTVPNFTAIRSGSVPSNIGFTSSFAVTMGTGTSPGSTGYAVIAQRIEGYNVADLNLGTSSSKAFTLSFWINCSVSGTFGISFRNTGLFNATYCSTYTINSTNTWEYKTITVPAGAINSGTWLIDNTGGIEPMWDLGVGTLYSGTAGQMNTGANYFGVTGTTKLSSTTGATFYLTGVQLETGTVATPFERRSYGQELALCQRYYEYGTASASGWCKITSIFDAGAVSSINFKTTKRIPPTLATPSLNAGVYPNLQNFNVPRYEGGFSRGFRYTDENQTSFWNVTTGGGGSNDVCGFALVWTASCEL